MVMKRLVAVFAEHYFEVGLRKSVVSKCLGCPLPAVFQKCSG